MKKTSGPMQDLPSWFPNRQPIYDIEKTYAENASQGPFFTGPIPERPKQTQKIRLFDHELSSPIGVPAGPLLNSRWVALAAKLGFDLVTYKTIRSFAHPGHGLPNMIFVQPLDPTHARMSSTTPKTLDDLTVTNSFGMPSKSPDFLLEDIARAQHSLHQGQALIVSFVGSPNQEGGLKQDFVRAALLAVHGGAKLLEANFSCPNVGKTQGMLYMDPATVYEFTQAIATAIKPLPLILKIGLFPAKELMHKVLLAAARGGAQGICGINSVSMRVVNQKDQSALGDQRAMSGVCGAAIRPFAVRFLSDAASINSQEKLNLTLLGCGGVMQPEHFDELISSGAAAALSATGMMWDPLLALRYHWSKSHVP